MMAVQQTLMALNGDEAVAYAVKQCDVDFVAAFPITPQTIIVEKFSEFVANGEVNTEFVRVESEHSALSACIGAAAAGGRAFTATAANGLQLMNEICYIASSLRLPIVMAIVNRAPSGPINIHTDHSDSMNVRDAGWIQLYTEDAQEAYDTTIQAFKIAERHDVLLPVMVMLDGFLISHTLQNVYLLPDEAVREFLGGPRKPPKIKLFGREVELALKTLAMGQPVPVTMGPLDLWDYYFEHKRQQFEAFKNAKKAIKEVNEEYAKISGRKYGNGLVHPFWTEDADIVVACMGSTAGTVRHVLRELRKEGEKIGLLRIRSFRPFPYEDVMEHLSGAKAVIVFDRSVDMGAQGAPLFVEIRSALYDLDERPFVYDYVYGLGGRDMPPSLIKAAIRDAKEAMSRRERFVKKYWGVRE